jgi:hypothetical protein
MDAQKFELLPTCFIIYKYSYSKLIGLRFSSKTIFWPVTTLFMSKSRLINSIIFNRKRVILISGCPNYSIGLMEVFWEEKNKFPDD